MTGIIKPPDLHHPTYRIDDIPNFPFPHAVIESLAYQASLSELVNRMVLEQPSGSQWNWKIQ